MNELLILNMKKEVYYPFLGREFTEKLINIDITNKEFERLAISFENIIESGSSLESLTILFDIAGLPSNVNDMREYGNKLSALDKKNFPIYALNLLKEKFGNDENMAYSISTLEDELMQSCDICRDFNEVNENLENAKFAYHIDSVLSNKEFNFKRASSYLEGNMNKYFRMKIRIASLNFNNAQELADSYRTHILHGVNEKTSRKKLMELQKRFFETATELLGFNENAVRCLLDIDGGITGSEHFVIYETERCLKEIGNNSQYSILNELTNEIMRISTKQDSSKTF